MNHHSGPSGAQARGDARKPSVNSMVASGGGGGASHLLHVAFRGKVEKLLISDGDSTEDVKELLRMAASAGPHDVVKLFNGANAMIPTSARLAPNGPDAPYRLEVVACGIAPQTKTSTVPHKKKSFFAANFNSSTAAPTVSTCDQHATEIERMTKRIARLESQVYPGGDMALEGISSSSSSSSNVSGSALGVLEGLCHRMEDIRQRLERVEHLNCMGLRQPAAPLNPGQHSPQPNPSSQSIRKTSEECRRVGQQFKDLCQKSELKESVRQMLRLGNFNNWTWEDAELIFLLRQMYIDLEFHLTLNIELEVLETWLFRVYQNYNHVPFHNFKHAFMVAQMMYALIWQTKLRSKLDAPDLFALLTAAICHDLDHPGYNNVYQINARTQLAVRYNDVSPLENHHSAMTFDIVSQNGCCLFGNFTTEAFKRVREGMIRCILATDMAKHNQILQDFREALPNFSYENQEHKNLLMMVLIKVSDISNEARPIQVSEPWLNCLLEEFFCQSDAEKIQGLPVTPFMDRDKVTKSSSQVGFIKFVILPLFDSLAELLPEVKEVLIDPVRRQLEYYEALQKEDLQKNASASASASSSSSSINSAAAATEAPSEGAEAAPANGVTNNGDGGDEAAT